MIKLKASPLFQRNIVGVGHGLQLLKLPQPSRERLDHTSASLALLLVCEAMATSGKNEREAGERNGSFACSFLRK